MQVDSLPIFLLRCCSEALNKGDTCYKIHINETADEIHTIDQRFLFSCFVLKPNDETFPFVLVL